MKRSLSFILVLVLLLSSFSFSSVYAASTLPTVYSSTYNSGTRDVICTSLSGTGAADYYTGSYTYDYLSDLSSSALLQSLRSLLTSTHTKQTNYSECQSYAPKTDCQNGNGKVTLLYTGCEAADSSWNREHVWPKSLGGYKTSGPGADLHHIRPTDSRVNSTRSSLKFGEVTNGKTATGNSTSNSAVGGYYSSSYFEPLDNTKGDVARICLYMYVRYGGMSQYTCSSITTVFQSVDVLLAWMELDPVDTWEMGRNEVIENIQGNRNVFIDYPELAWQLFGQEVPADLQTPSGNASDTTTATTPTTVPTTATTATSAATTPATEATSATEPALSGSTYVKVDDPSSLSAGFYMIGGTSTSADSSGATAGFISGTFDSKNHLTCGDLTVSGNQIANSDTNLVWELIAASGGFYIRNADTGEYLVYGSKTSNAIYVTDSQSDAGIWKVASNGDAWTLEELSSGRQLSVNTFGSGTRYLGAAAYKSTTTTARDLVFYKLSTGTVSPTEPATQTSGAGTTGTTAATQTTEVTADTTAATQTTGVTAGTSLPTEPAATTAPTAASTTSTAGTTAATAAPTEPVGTASGTTAATTAASAAASTDTEAPTQASQQTSQTESTAAETTAHPTEPSATAVQTVPTAAQSSGDLTEPTVTVPSAQATAGTQLPAGSEMPTAETSAMQSTAGDTVTEPTQSIVTEPVAEESTASTVWPTESKPTVPDTPEALAALKTSIAELPETEALTLTQKETVQTIAWVADELYEADLLEPELYEKAMAARDALRGLLVTDITQRIHALPEAGNVSLADRETVALILLDIAFLDDAHQAMLPETDLEKLEAVKTALEAPAETEPESQPEETDAETQTQAPAPTEPQEDPENGPGSVIYILLGVLLAATAAALILWYHRRRQKDPD